MTKKKTKLKPKRPRRHKLKGRRKAARSSVWDREVLAVGGGGGEEGRAAAALARLKTLERGMLKGYWASDSSPLNWPSPEKRIKPPVRIVARMKVLDPIDGQRKVGGQLGSKGWTETRLTERRAHD